VERTVETLALFSDVHGNRPAIEAVLDDLRARKITRVYCLGDLVGYGADPNGVIDLIRGQGVESILGNYDEGIAWETGDCGCFYADAEARRIGEASYAFTVAAVTAERKAYLRTLPRELHADLADKKVHLVHGSPRRINEYLLRDRDERTYARLAKTESDDVLAFGHTHDPWFRWYGETLFVSVGSVGRPKDGDPRAAYVVLRSSAGTPVEAEIGRVTYDVEAAAAAMLAAGLPAALAEALHQGR
jgi:predicted phosphodiesterase